MFFKERWGQVFLFQNEAVLNRCGQQSRNRHPGALFGRDLLQGYPQMADKILAQEHCRDDEAIQAFAPKALPLVAQ